MIIRDLGETLRDQPFLRGLEDRFFRLIVGCASNARFKAGERLFQEGGPADRFYLIRDGAVALEISAPGRTLTVQTLRKGELVGVSWLVPPYRWTYDARAVEPVRVVAIDAACLRNKSEADHDLGYEMMKRFMPIMVQRLHSARLQVLDVYGEHA